MSAQSPRWCNLQKADKSRSEMATSLSLIQPLHSLPLEIILDITSYLPAEAFISFAFAHFALLRRCGLAPSLSTQQLANLVEHARLPRFFRLVPLPSELLLQTMRYLSNHASLLQESGSGCSKIDEARPDEAIGHDLS